MQGWLIFKHAVLMLWQNKIVALRLAVVPFLIGIAAIVVFVSMFSDMDLMQEMMFPGSPIGNQPELMPEQMPGFFTGLIGFLVLSLAFTLWVIVAWHRFILLEEYPEGLIPPFNGNRVLAYFGQILKIMLIGMLLAIPIGIVMAFAGQNFVLMIVFGTIVGVVLIVVFYRISIILPGSAIGKPVTIREAWDATKGASFAIVVLVVLGGVAQMIVQFVAGFFIVVPVLGFAINLLVSFAIGMINASILTTLYGHYIEGREL